MGNETSIIKKCNVSCKPRFTTTQWSLFDADCENQLFSAFIFNNDDYCNDFNKWKHVRHPYLVKFYEYGVYKNKKYILTEPVIPLRQVLKKFHRFSRLSGLYNVGDALNFMHTICHISVNNLCIDSIFISKNDPNELWKLGSLYWCSTMQSDDENFIKNLLNFHEKIDTIQILPKEYRDRNKLLPITSNENIHHRDIYSFVLLIQELFYNPNIQPKLSDILSVTDKSNHNFMAKTLIDNFYQCNLNEWPTIQAILNDQLFQNCPFVHLRQFLSNFSTYSDEEKFNFLQYLIQNLRQFSDQSLIVSIFTMIVSSRFIMSNSLVYNNVIPYFLIPLLNKQSNSITEQHLLSTNKKENQYILTNGEVITLNPFIDEQTFRDDILPHIIKLYCVHDYKIRILLLKYLPHYCAYISRTCLKKILLPQILLGIKDSNKELVALTFRAVASLIDIFGVHAVLGGSNRNKYFTSNVSGDNENSNSSSLSIENNNNSERRNSINSTKSSILSGDDDVRKLDTVVFERSSPDGGETLSNENITNKTNSVMNKFPSLNIVDINSESTSDHDEWPDWEENKQSSSMITTKTTNPTTTITTTTSNSKKIDANNDENFQTFDIKEIDFNKVNYSKEIDNLFMDMTPVLNFNNKNNQKKKSFKKNLISNSNDNKINNDNNNVDISRLKINIDSSIFDDKNTIDDNENSGWNDDNLDWNDIYGTIMNDNNESDYNINDNSNKDSNENDIRQSEIVNQ